MAKSFGQVLGKSKLKRIYLSLLAGSTRLGFEKGTKVPLPQYRGKDIMRMPPKMRRAIQKGFPYAVAAGAGGAVGYKIARRMSRAASNYVNQYPGTEYQPYRT